MEMELQKDYIAGRSVNFEKSFENNLALSSKFKKGIASKFKKGVPDFQYCS